MLKGGEVPLSQSWHHLHLGTSYMAIMQAKRKHMGCHPLKDTIMGCSATLSNFCIKPIAAECFVKGQ